MRALFSSCSAGYYRSEGMCIERQHIEGCNAFEEIEDKCTECLKGYFLDGDKCSKCDDNCETCEREATRCTSCVDNTYLEDDVCVLECKIGTYGASVDNTCKPNPVGCRVAKSDGKCKTCEEASYNSLGTCIERQNNQGCSGYSEFADSCTGCNAGYYKAGNGCMKCANDCATCNNGSTCDGCHANELLKEGRCISASLGCGKGYKQNGVYCNRVRYTPGEANEVLDDENNTVVLTFKKK